MAKEEKEQFYTGEGVDVTERIATGKTRFFKSLTLAQWWADLRRSYRYEVFDGPTPGKRQLIGYGIPR